MNKNNQSKIRLERAMEMAEDAGAKVKKILATTGNIDAARLAMVALVNLLESSAGLTDAQIDTAMQTLLQSGGFQIENGTWGGKIVAPINSTLGA